MSSIGDILLRMLADDLGFEADVVKKAQKAGDKAGLTMGQRMSKGLVAGLSVLGAAGGALVGIAARGANELTDAMANFRAETGATQEEVESARKSVLELSKSNLQSFEEIARTQAKLRTDLGLTQKEAEAATEAFLKYGTATGRNAAEGVTALDDILDAWNLDASKSQEIMDKLVASHQEYGGSITDNEQSLSRLAPQLQALNLEVDDGIALLNLFAEGGLDASKAQFALNSAIQKLPPGTTLEEFVAHLASIEDPAQRAREAIEVFGARGGAGLANVIRPGMKGLDDFAISMEDAAGATNEAAEAIENTPFNQLKMVLRSIAAPAIEAGQAFGPLILALSQLGGGRLVVAATTALGGLAGALTGKLGVKFATAGGKLGEKLIGGIAASAAASSVFADGIATAIGKIPGASKVINALTLAGSKMGGILGKAMAAGVFLAIPLIAIEIQNQMSKEFEEGQGDTFKSVGEKAAAALADGSMTGLQEAKASLEAAWREWQTIPPSQAKFVAQENLRTLRTQLIAAMDKLKAEGHAGGRGFGSSWADGVEEGIKQNVSASGGTAAIRTAIETGLANIKTMVETAGQAIPGAYADGILQEQSVVKTAMAGLVNQMNTELSRGQEIAYLIGVLTSEEVVNGLNDKRPGVREAARATQQAAQDRLKVLVPQGKFIGGAANEALAKGMKDKDPKVRNAAATTKGIIERSIKPNTRPAGQSAVNQITTQLNNGRGRVGGAAAALARTIVTRLMATIQAGLNTPGRYGYSEKGRAAGGPVVAGQAYIVGERRPELFVPNVSGKILPYVPPMSDMQPWGGAQVNLQTYGIPMRAETPAEVVNRIKRASRLGTVSPRPKPGSWER